MSSDCLPPMIVELFGGDEIFPDTKKRKNGDNFSNLAKLVKKCGLLKEVPNLDVEDERQFRVLGNISGYLNEMKVATAVIETEYVDRDYLDDYVRFYSRCYVKYPRRCHRIHFFKNEYKKEFIEDLLAKPDPSTADESGASPKDDAFTNFAKDYLGFVVIRPLATGLVGRTCLKSYPDENGRHYTAMCDVKVSFFGRELTVRCMPFIQQDSATAVCAGCALWSTFMVTAQLFQHKRYCPGCITELATGHGLSDKRNFPNGGLFIRDMAYAMRSVGLAPINLAYDSDTPMDRMHQLGNIYAYLSAGLPIVLTGALRRSDNTVKGEHAVVVNGYHMPAGRSGSSFLFSDRIDKIYVHDDQIGPGARMTNPTEISRDGDGKNILKWKTHWPDELSKEPDTMKMEVHALLIPTYHKIRVDYEMIFRQIEPLEMALKNTVEVLTTDSAYKSLSPLASKCKIHEWNIRLLTAKDHKREIRQEDEELMSTEEKLRILEKGYPRYVWDINLLGDGNRELRFVVDATDSGQNLNVLDVLFYQGNMATIFHTMAGREWHGAELKTNPLMTKFLKTVLEQAGIGKSVTI